MLFSSKFTQINVRASWYNNQNNYIMLLEKFGRHITFEKCYLQRHLIKSFGEIID